LKIYQIIDEIAVESVNQNPP